MHWLVHIQFINACKRCLCCAAEIRAPVSDFLVAIAPYLPSHLAFVRPLLRHAGSWYVVCITLPAGICGYLVHLGDCLGTAGEIFSNSFGASYLPVTRYFVACTCMGVLIGREVVVLCCFCCTQGKGAAPVRALVP